MTANQIAYWNLKEQERSNKVKEAETARSNVAKETETSRHNIATEGETARSNRAAEYENYRSHKSNELIANYNAKTTRKKMYLEDEVNRTKAMSDRMKAIAQLYDIDSIPAWVMEGLGGLLADAGGGEYPISMGEAITGSGLSNAIGNVVSKVADSAGEFLGDLGKFLGIPVRKVTEHVSDIARATLGSEGAAKVMQMILSLPGIGFSNTLLPK